MKQVNPNTLEIMNTKDNKAYVYVVVEEGCWDGEQILEVEVFDTFAKALEEFEKRSSSAISDMNDWCSDEELVKTKVIDEDTEYASTEIHKDGEYNGFHCSIEIKKREVK